MNALGELPSDTVHHTGASWLAKPDPMPNSVQESAIADRCLTAAEVVQRKLMSVAREVMRTGDPSVGPRNPLPVDDFLSGMVKRKNAPRLVFDPRRLKDHLWTESRTAYIYAGIERAFLMAGRLSSDNRSGHARKLKDLRAWVIQQQNDPGRKPPKHFVQETALLFSKGILEERRRERILVLQRIGSETPSSPADLEQLRQWIEEDLEDPRLDRKGRPVDYQKIVFAVEIANLWNVLTCRPITKGPETNFAQFLVACWRSGFDGADVNDNFKRILRYHIEESTESCKCGRCPKCRNSKQCDQKRYFGILM